MAVLKGNYRLILFLSVIIFHFSGCKDIVFNNPLDPEASKEPLRLIKVLTTDLSGAGDLAFDGEKIWKILQSGTLYALDRESGISIRNIRSIPGTGMTFLKNTIYTCDGSNILSKIDPLAGELLDQVSTTELYAAYLSALDDQLIVYDRRSDNLFSFSPEEGSFLQLFQASGLAVGGIETFRGGILISDQNTDSIYYFSLTGGIINVYRSPAGGINGITVDDRGHIYLFAIDGKIYEVSLP